MRETALGQLNLEAVLALRLWAAPKRLRRLAKGGLGRRLADQGTFRLNRPPRLSADTAERDAGMRDLSACDADHHRGRGKRKLVGGAIPQLEIDGLVSRR